MRLSKACARRPPLRRDPRRRRGRLLAAHGRGRGEDEAGTARAARERRCGSPTPGSRSIQILPRCMRCEASRRFISASSSRQSPIFSSRFALGAAGHSTGGTSVLGGKPYFGLAVKCRLFAQRGDLCTRALRPSETFPDRAAAGSAGLVRGSQGRLQGRRPRPAARQPAPDREAPANQRMEIEHPGYLHPQFSAPDWSCRAGPLLSEDNSLSEITMDGV